MKLDGIRSEPGIHFDMPAEDYHAMKRLSASGAWTLADDCAAKFLWHSPWNPLAERDDKPEFDLGTAAHLAILEPGRFAAATAIVDAGDYRTSKAREARDTAREAGKTPLLPYQLDIVHAIAGSIRSHPIAAEAFAGGDPEVTLTWCDAGTEVPCKARIDWLPRHGRWLADLKTAASANPLKWRDQAARFGYHARAAWYLDGAEAVFLRRPQEYWFVCIESKAPYLVSVIALDEPALEYGRMINRKALDLFCRCVEQSDWPGYREPGANRDRAFRVGLPPWLLYQLQDRNEAGEFGSMPARSPKMIDAALIRAAQKLYSPNPSEV